MTLHWWHHWFWITGQAPVVLMLLVALPRCLCDQPGGFHGSPGSRRLQGFAERDPAPMQPLAYLTTAPMPPMTPDREPKAIGLAPPTHPSAPSSPPPASSPSAVVEIVEEVEEEVKNANGTHTEEETVVAAAAELGVTTPATLPEESPSPSSESASFNASVAPQGDTSEEMLNDEPAHAVTSERPPMSPSPMTPVLGGSDTTSESPPNHPSSASPLILPTTPATARPFNAPVDEPVHPAVDLNTTPVPVPVSTPISNSSSRSSSSTSTGTTTATTTSTMNPTTTAAPVTALPAHHHEVQHEDRAAAVAPLGALGAARPHRGAMGSGPGLDAGSITGIVLGIVVFAGLVGTISFVLYRRRYLNKPQTLNDKCSNPDSSGYIDDSTLRENSEEMYSLDNDSFLNSLEAMTIQNYWTDSVKHTKL